MICFPNAKINLGLSVLGKRPDGYHDIESVFYPVPLCDALEIRESQKMSFEPSGLSIPGDSASNLCLKAYELIKADFDIPPVDIHLHKVIPMGGGLGGGSSDGAFMINLLTDLFDLEISVQAKENYASQLGSDCPFFVRNTPSIATGKGIYLTPIDLDLSGYKLALVFPDIHSSTAEAYSGISPATTEYSCRDIVKTNPEKWKSRLYNDFEMSIFRIYPALKSIKENLYETGAIYASMTGSGSVIFGLFDKEKELDLDISHSWINL